MSHFVSQIEKSTVSRFAPTEVLLKALPKQQPLALKPTNRPSNNKPRGF
jgi:hypothetical protein